MTAYGTAAGVMMQEVLVVSIGSNVHSCRLIFTTSRQRPLASEGAVTVLSVLALCHVVGNIQSDS